MLSARQIHKTTHKAKGCNYQAIWVVIISFSTDFIVKCAEKWTLSHRHLGETEQLIYHSQQGDKILINRKRLGQ